MLRAVSLGAAAFQNFAAVDRRLLTSLTRGREGHLSGGAVTAAAGALAVNVAAHDSLVLADGGAGERGTYFVTNSEAQMVAFPAAGAQARVDALVLAVRDSQYGGLPAGTADGPAWVVVAGTVTGGAATAPTDAQIAAVVGPGGWWRRADIAVAANAAVVGAITNRAPSALASTPWRTVGAAGEPIFRNGWSAFGTDTVQFRIDDSGNIHLRGRITGGADATTVFILPQGFRPDRDLQNNIVYTHAGSVSTVNILATGDVTVSLRIGAGIGSTALDGVTFAVA